MSQRARSEAESGEHREESSQLYAVDENANVIHVEQIGALTNDELAELEGVAAPEVRGLQSGAFSKDGGSGWGALRTQPPPLPAAAKKSLTSIEPFAGSVPAPPERAQLHITEIAFEVANPFIGSSLQPPPPRKHPWLRALLVSVAGCTLLGAGYYGAVYQKQQLTPTRDANTTLVQPMTSRTEIEKPRAAQPETTKSETVKPEITAPEVVQREVAKSEVDTTEATPAEKATPTRAQGKPARLSKASKASATAAASEPPAPERAAETASPAKLTAQLTRAQVQAGLEGARGAMTTCAAGAHGTIMTAVTITGAGRVSHASIEGAFAGTPQGSCMARALRTAQFPATTSAQLRVRYPFVF